MEETLYVITVVRQAILLENVQTKSKVVEVSETILENVTFVAKLATLPETAQKEIIKAVEEVEETTEIDLAAVVDLDVQIPTIVEEEAVVVIDKTDLSDAINVEKKVTWPEIVLTAEVWLVGLVEKKDINLLNAPRD